MAGPGQHGGVFSDIMILGALGAPTALHPLVITIQYTLAKPARSYALPLVVVKDVQELKPVHVMAGTGEHGDVFSDIMIFGALGVPTALGPLVINIQFTKIRESNNHFLIFFF